MHRALIYVAAAASLLVPACQAQSLVDKVDALRSDDEGLRLHGVSFFTGYSSTALPTGSGGGFISSNVGALNSDATYGTSATLGWQRHRERTSFSMQYTGSYTGMVHYSGANGFSQSLALNANRQLSPKWDFSLGASGQDATLIETLNQPSPISIVSQLPSAFNDFAAAFGLGSFTTAQAASMILGAPVVETPIRALLLGNKVLSYSGNAGLSYAYSPHLSFHASALGAGGQNRSGGQDGIPNYVTPASFTANAGMSWSYSLSPRTELGIGAEATRMFNHFQSSYGGTTTASLGRKMGEHWFLRVYGGATVLDVTQQLFGTAKTRQVVGGGSIGVKTYLNSFVVSYDRSGSDSYGIVGTYTTLSGAWNRHHAGSRFSTFASLAQQQMRNTGFESFSGWQASAGFSEKLTSNIALHTQYVYLKTGSSYLGAANSFSVHSVRVSMNWSPEPIQR